MKKTHLRRSVSALLICAMLLSLCGYTGTSIAAADADTPASVQRTYTRYYEQVYEAENAVGNGTSVNTDHTGYSGTGFVDNFNATGKYIDFQINIPVTGDYSFILRYANATGHKAHAHVYLDGEIQETIPLHALSDWNTWGSSELGATMVSAGTHTLRISFVDYAVNIDNWIEIKQPSVTFSNVPPGKYVFEVRGANGTGMWNDQPARLEIEICPPYYASTMAYAVYVLSIAVIIWLYVSWYVRKTRQRSDFEIKELKRKQEQQEYRAKIAFFTNITHEIRTPLSLIRGPYEQIIRPGIRPSDYKENLKIMGANIDRLLNLSNQLLDFQKIDSMGFALNRSDVNLNDLLEKCMLQFSQKMQQKRIRSVVSVPDDPVVLYADEEALTKIVCNLLDNAVKHAQNKVGLCLEVASERDRVVISIENDGDAIPGIYFGKIFEPFFQIKGDAKGGTGLGLSLVKHLVEQHGGNISVFSDASSSRFVVDLPWQRRVCLATVETNISQCGEERILFRRCRLRCGPKPTDNYIMCWLSTTIRGCWISCDGCCRNRIRFPLLTMPMKLSEYWTMRM